MRPISAYQLWLGNAREGRDVCAILDAGIAAVVDLAAEEPPAALVRELVYCRFPLIDGADNAPWLLRSAINAINGLLRNGVPTLVCCGAGMSRAPAIAACAIATIRGCSLADALAMVLPAASGDVSPRLLADLNRLSDPC